MAGTFTQIHIQVVFPVKYREALIIPEWEEVLHKYITGIVQRKGQKMLSINSALDHIHFLIGMRPNCSLSSLVQEVKKSSDQFVNENHFCRRHFQWQDGFGAFSYRKRDISRVIKYIENQKDHHQKKQFRSEYIKLLKEFEIEYKEEYLFEWFDDFLGRTDM